MAHRQHAAAAILGRLEAAVYPHSLLGVPAQVGGRVGNLAAGLGQRLAHLQGHDQREVLGALDHKLVGAAQNLAALARRDVAEADKGLVGGGQSGLGILRRGVCDFDQCLAGRGILNGHRRAAAGVAPLATNKEAPLDSFEG